MASKRKFTTSQLVSTLLRRAQLIALIAGPAAPGFNCRIIIRSLQCSIRNTFMTCFVFDLIVTALRFSIWRSQRKRSAHRSVSTPPTQKDKQFPQHKHTRYIAQLCCLTAHGQIRLSKRLPEDLSCAVVFDLIVTALRFSIWRSQRKRSAHRSVSTPPTQKDKQFPQHKHTRYIAQLCCLTAHGQIRLSKRLPEDLGPTKLSEKQQLFNT